MAGEIVVSTVVVSFVVVVSASVLVVAHGRVVVVPTSVSNSVVFVVSKSRKEGGEVRRQKGPCLKYRRRDPVAHSCIMRPGLLRICLMILCLILKILISRGLLLMIWQFILRIKGRNVLTKNNMSKIIKGSVTLTTTGGGQKPALYGPRNSENLSLLYP